MLFPSPQTRCVGPPPWCYLLRHCCFLLPPPAPPQLHLHDSQQSRKVLATPAQNAVPNSPARTKLQKVRGTSSTGLGNSLCLGFQLSKGLPYIRHSSSPFNESSFTYYTHISALYYRNITLPTGPVHRGTARSRQDCGTLLTIFFSSSSFSPTKSRPEGRPLQLASRHTQARCPSRAPSYPKSVVRQDRVPYTLVTPAVPSRAAARWRIHLHHSHNRLSELVMIPIPDHHHARCRSQLERRPASHHDHGVYFDFEHCCSGRGGR